MLDTYNLDINPKKDKVSRIHDILVEMTIAAMTILALALCIFKIFDFKGLLYAILRLPAALKFCSIIYCLYLVGYYIASSTLIVVLLFSYVYHLIIFYAFELRLGRPKYRCSNILRLSPENLRLEYRAVQILHKSFF